MERYRGPPLASPQQTLVTQLVKTESGSRPRRRLQKSGVKSKSLSSAQAKSPHVAVPPPLTKTEGPREPSNRLETGPKLGPSLVGLDGQPSISLPPDLSDSKWLEYIRKSGFLCAADSSQSKESLSLPVSMVPEFSHLAVASSINNNIRPSFESGSTESTQASSAPAMSSIRRRAKTPVFSIGQLESAPPPLTRDALSANKASSVELIADQYRALIEHRDMEHLFGDAHSEPPPSRQGYRDEEQPGLRRQFSSDDFHSAAFLDAQTNSEPSAQSPTSDDGTLVSFEEETVYFKPISFSPEPHSPAQMCSPGFGSPMTSPYNLSLQICLELLTRELSTAISGRRQKTPNETAALQIWVMIEAYERLRDQVAEMRLSLGEASGVETLFDTWLMALYSIHDSLAAEARREVDEGEYEGLEEALD